MGRMGSRLGTDGDGCRNGTRRILTPNEKERVRESRKHERRRVVGLRSNTFVGRISAKLDSMNPAKSPFTSLLAVAIALIATFSASNIFAQEKKPNIVFIMGDDIGMWNIGAYHRGMMAGRTPNLDKLAKEGMLFTDYYAEASCTAGRANFITGQLPIRTGMTRVGQAGAKTGLPAQACTIATALKAQGYATG